jgi:hypothetical protein
MSTIDPRSDLMAKKPVSKPFQKTPAKATPAKSSPTTTVSRNTPVPRPAAKREITHEMIAKRAYEIYASGKGGSQLDNWFRAERELKAGL